MNFISLFSGIGGFDLALERVGMTCVGQVEIDKHCQEVLHLHWPHVPRWSDVRDFRRESLDGTVDLVCGGFPCVDVSTAGKRRGLAGSESGLWFEFYRVITELRPKWVLIENVPGLLSSNNGRDMGTILGGLADIGYGWAYRILDSKYFGVPQRRRRVYIVGCAGGAVACAAQVLFESEGVRGDTSPRGQEEQATAGDTGEGADGSGIAAFDWSVAGSARTAITRKGDYAQLRAGGTDAVHIPEHAKALRASDGGIDREDMHTLIVDETEVSGFEGRNLTETGDVAGTLQSKKTGGYSLNYHPMVFETRVARNGRGMPEEVVPPLKSQSGKSGSGDSASVLYYSHDYAHERIYGDDGVTNALAAGHTRQQQSHFTGGGIRRLTPTECLRLQSLPDDWMEGQSDTAIYKATGNAVTVNVISWIGKRLLEANHGT